MCAYMSAQDLPLLFCSSQLPVHHPRDMLLTRLPVPPVCIRPSVVSDTRSGTTEDDITMKLTEIAFINDNIRADRRDGGRIQRIMDEWEYLQVRARALAARTPGTGSVWSVHQQ
jgi:DNA-directed RNA polymerase III subunit RPC1